MPEVEVAAFDLHALLELTGLLVLAFESSGEAGTDILERNAPLGPLRPSHRRNHVSEIERQRVGEYRFRRAGCAEEPLSLGVGLDKCQMRLLAACHAQVVQRLRVDGEVTARRTV